MPGESTHGDPWLMVIDMQVAFGDATSRWFVDGFDQARKATLGLLPIFGSRVIYTRFVPPAWAKGGWIPYYERWPEFSYARAAPPEDAGDSIWDIDLGDAPIQHVLDAPTFSKWAPDRLPPAAVEAGELFVAGVALECCVLATVLAAIDDGMRINLVEDAVEASSREARQAAMTILRKRDPLVTVLKTHALKSTQELRE